MTSPLHKVKQIIHRITREVEGVRVEGSEVLEIAFQHDANLVT